jgi:hypothetical protein
MRVSIAIDPREWSDQEMVRVWSGLVRRGPHALYASPVWFEHLRRVKSDSGLGIGICRSADGSICGIAPLAMGSVSLKYQVGNRCFGSPRLRAAHILGSEPLLPTAAFADLCHEIFEVWPDCDCLYMDSVPEKSALWGPLRHVPGLVYVANGLGPWHMIELGSSAEAYFGSIGAKSRSTLRRKQRRLDSEVGGLRLLRVDAAAQVPNFVTHAMTVSRTSWQHRVLGARITPNEIASLI